MLKSKIDKCYDQHDCSRITQGDILRDLSFIVVGEKRSQIKLEFPYIIVLSQDCDLQSGSKIIELPSSDKVSTKEFNQYLPNILFAPAFPSEILREGTHLEDLYHIRVKCINSDLWKPITNNENPRYHYLPDNADLQLPNLVVDFKAYYTLPFYYFLENYKNHYLATVNELFRERLSQRFANYLNRIGTPELQVEMR